jgi:hypothetical protein
LPKGRLLKSARGATHAGAARVAHGDRVVLLEGGAQQLAAFALVGRAGHADVGNAAQKGDVVVARVRGAVGAHQAGAVEREHHRQVLQRHVVDQLVVAALQEGGVDGHHGLEPSQARPAAKVTACCSAMPTS